MTDLRQRAEAFLETNPEAMPTMDTANVKKLVHELAVYQVELEMQNEELREAQLALAHSRDAYAELYEFAPIGYLSLDRNGVVVEANQTAAIMLGVETSTLLRRKFAEFVKRDARDEWFRHRRQVLAGNAKPSAELPLARGDGTTFTARLECRFRPGAHAKDWRSLMALSDVTDRVQAEHDSRRADSLARERLREIEDLYRNAPVGLCVLDCELRYVRVNERLAEINGMPAAEHIGKRIHDLLPELADTAEPGLRRVLETGEPRLNVEIVGETPARPGAQRSWLEHWLPIKNNEGRVTGLSIVAEETTARKEAEEALIRLNNELEQRVEARTAALAESETKYRNLVENTLDITCTVDGDGVLRFVAPQAARYGLDPAELEGRNFLDIVFPEDRERMAADFQKAMDSGELFPSDFRIQGSDGVTYWFEERGALLRDASGKITGVTTVLRDITERRAAETREQAALHRLRAFEAAVNQGPGVVFRWRIVPGEWPVEMVTANVRQFGYDIDDFLRGRVSWPGITHPEDTPALEAEVKERLAKGERQFHQHYRLITKAGEVRHVEDWNAVLTGPDGVPTHIQAIVMDVTHHREEERRRQESEERYRSLTSNIPGMIYRGQSDWAADFIMNSDALCGYSADELVSGEINWVDLIHPDDRQQVMEEASNVPALPASVVQEYRVRTKDGRVRWVRDHKTFSCKPDGSFIHVDGIVYDMTDHKRAELETQRSEQRFRALAEQSPNMIFIHHRGRVVYANPTCEELMGYTREEFYAAHFDFLSLHAPESVALVQTRFEQEMRGKELPPCEIALVTKEGKRLDAILSTRLIDYEGDKAILGVLTDITARKRAEQLCLQHQDQLRHLAAKLASAQDEEQRRIAEGLHDDVAQLMVACSTKMAVADRVKSRAQARKIHDEIDALLREAGEKVRSLSFELSSSTLYRLGLWQACQELCESMSTRYGIRFELKGAEHAAKLNEATATVLFKAVRELLFNVVKHAQVKTATVAIGGDGRTLTLAVEDCGTGFPRIPGGDEIDTRRGVGLFGIRERMRDLGGTMRIDSEPNIRTCVSLTLPLGRG